MKRKIKNKEIVTKKIDDVGKNGRVVIKLALGQDEEHNKNSIIILMKLNISCFYFQSVI
ncbi:MAG: hypothetical protein HFJ57_03855 [Clostridia bacterium]|nr:hypothetical protein [Clostridia bacterium]